MECPNCQTENPAQAKFCMSCGKAMPISCPNCGTKLPAEAVFCFNCGHKVAEPTGTTVQQPESATKKDEEPSHLQRYVPKELLAKLERAREGGEMEGERRIVTMLFCDVKGSTAAAGQLDPEEWAGIINGAFEHLITPVYRYEGTVARLMGDGILAFFGAPIAHEDDPQRAVLAGLDILASVRTYREQVKKEWDLDIDVRVGINTGLVVVGAVGSDLRMEYTALGDAINLAARMEQSAQPGTMQIAEATYKLVAPLFHLEDLGEAVVKGKEDPVRSYRVLSQRVEPGRMRGIEGLESPLVGRDSELHTLRGLMIALRQGQSAIVSIIGEAGLGKSRLAAELRESPRPVSGDKGKMRWLEGRSLSYETTTPYAPFIRIFSDCFELAPEAGYDQHYSLIVAGISTVVKDRADEIAPFIASMLGVGLKGEALERVRYLEPPQLRSRIFQATREFLEAMAAQQPLVLVFDDLHWVDSTSFELLESLLPVTDRGMLMIISLFRPRRQEPSWTFHEMVQREYTHRYTVIDAKPLDDEDSRELVANLLYVDDLPLRVRELIMEKAEGNPFFVEEVIRSLLDSRLIIRQDGRWQATREIADITIPDSLTAVLTTRLDQLDESSRQLLQIAAVIGRQFNEDTLADVFGVDAAMHPSVTDLLKRELIREKRRLPKRVYMFKHNLTQQAAYNSLLLRKRRELHRLVGESIERREPDRVNDIGRHFKEAGDRERALPFIVEAGERAARAYSTAIAIDYFREALQMLGTVDNLNLTRNAYEGLGSALTFANDFPGAINNYEAMLAQARESNDVPMQVSALNKLSYISALRMGQFQQAEAHLEEADRLAREKEDKVGISEADLVRCQMCVALGDFNGVVKYMNETIQLGQELGIQEQEALGLAHIASSQIYLGQFEAARETMLKGLALSRKIGDREHEAEILVGAASLYHYCNGDLRASRESLQEGIEIAIKIGAAHLEIEGWRGLGIAAYQEGQYEEAIEHFNKYLEVARETGLVWFEVEALCVMGSVYLDISPENLEQVLKLHDQAEGLMEQPGGIMIGASAWAEIGYCAVQVGDLDKAAGLFQKGLTVPTITKNLEQARLMHGQALLKLKQDEVEKAEGLLEEARLIAQGLGMRIIYPLIDITMGRVYHQRGDLEKAAEKFETAENEAVGMGLLPLILRARAAAAEVLQTQGKTAEANRKIKDAQSAIDEMASFFKDPELRRSYIVHTSSQMAAASTT